MIIKQIACCHLEGVNFSPSKVIMKTKLSLQNIKERNQPLNLGPNKGTPSPTGSASISFEESSDDNNNSLYLLVETLKKHLTTIRNCGAEEIYIYLGVWYKDQCNLAFDPEILREIGELRIPLWVSCYQDYCSEENQD
ncbi:hypothetical protein E0485_05830 [Paenibacillus albiflavus]|uniref:DUF4279 domain-containing protein n=1 Tax=Paenibacillus albiflavus TaxID=2545760 RepID=A0A4R4EJE5_9BACL|nr:hypothetical protein [Paenibacillus albiflavus]TCZ79380.1 hypothetical protein E0485_05830 [Paenibacillus albiflavus]